LSKINYLTLFIQYLKDNNIKSRVSCTQEVEDKTAETTYALTKTTLKEFGINGKKVIITTDNASAM
jgi:hypothetical protein